MILLSSFKHSASLAVFAVLVGCASNVPAPVVDRSVSQQGIVLPEGSAESVKPNAVVDRVAQKGHYIVKPGDTLYRIALDHGQSYRDLVAWNGLEDPNRIEVGRELRVSALEGGDGQLVAVAKPVGMNREIEQRSLDGNSDAVKSQPKAGRETYSEETLVRLGKVSDSVLPRTVLPLEVKMESKPEVRALASQARGDDELLWTWPSNGKLASQFVEGGSKGLDILGRKGDPVLAAADGKVVYSGTGLRGYGQLLIIKHNNTFLTAYAHSSKILVKEGVSVTRGQKIAEMGDTETDQVKLHFEVRRQGKPVDPLKHLPPR